MSNFPDRDPPAAGSHSAFWASVAGVIGLSVALTGAGYWAGNANSHDAGLDMRMTALEAKLDHVSDAVQTKLDAMSDKLTDVDVSIARIEGDRRVPPRTP